MKATVERMARALGTSLAEAHVSLCGSAWAEGDTLKTFARVVWQSEADTLMADDDISGFVAAYADAYQAYQS